MVIAVIRWRWKDVASLYRKRESLAHRKRELCSAFAGIERELRALSVMLRFSLVLVVLMLLGLPAEAQQGRNDYPDIIPHDWTLLPPKSNEWRAVSPRQDAWLSLYATPIDAPVSSHLRQWGVGEGDRVTYQRHGQGWTVVSGYTPDNRIFYRKTMLACRGRKWHNLEFEYPASDKSAMDEFVTRASYALGAYNRAGC
jgi:hypothetical protein